MPDAGLSVIIRARDEARNLARVLGLLRAQETGELTVEVILVDCGSSDDSLAVAASYGARTLELVPERFSFGRALNLGAATATGRVLISLSAHAFPRDRHWLMRLAA